MSHAYGFGMGFMVSLLTGARLVTLRQFNPRTITRVLAEQQVSIFPAVPAMLDLVLRAAQPAAIMPRLVLAAGAPLTEATATAFREQTSTPVTPLYGTTETGGISVGVAKGVRNQLCEAPEAPFRQLVSDTLCVLPTGCVGQAMNGVEARVAPIADAEELAPGVGRVMIRSSSMMSGYLTPQGIDASAINDGWFETGDLGRLDERGRIVLVGREKEIINVFGMKVVPSEVEEVIAALPGVREVKVYAGTHRSGSEMVQAAVAGNIDAAQVRGHCDVHLAPYKRPQVVHLVEALPRSPLGKILRDRLP
jgi:acyl-CoA synthetase (AMP-forming)/AMP-acid ligase II